MKRILALSCLVALLLAGCATQPATAPEASDATTVATTVTTAATTVTAGTTTTDGTVSTTTVSTTAKPTASTTAPPLSEAQSKIAALHINVVGGAAITSNEEYVAATVSLDGRASGFADLGAVGAQVRGRGHSTWLWDKKPYKIKLDAKASLCGMPEGRQWVLLANYADKALGRNYVATAMAATLSGLTYTPRQTFVELYLNGEYMGVYTLSEQIQVHENRVNIEENSPNADTGYLLELGGRDSDKAHDVINRDYFMAGLARHIRIKSPDTTGISQAQLDFIIGYVRDVNEAIMAHGDYESLIDVDSFIDWGILHELTYNMDSCYRRSCFMTKPAGGKLQMGPVWDFDLALGNYGKDPKGYDDLVTVGPGTEDLLDYTKLVDMNEKTYSHDDYYVILTWMNYLLSDQAFFDRYVARWNEVKDELMKAALQAINETGSLLDGAWQRNFKRWDVLGGKPGYGSSATAKITTYDGQLDYLRNFLQKRSAWLDSRLNAQ